MMTDFVQKRLANLGSQRRAISANFLDIPLKKINHVRQNALVFDASAGCTTRPWYRPSNR